MSVEKPGVVPVNPTISITINYHETATNSITDLTGTKWLINENPHVDAEIGSFYFNFNSNSIAFTGMYIGYDGQLEPVDNSLIYAYSRSIHVYDGVWENQAYRTIEITGGTAVTNATLISWLQSNATQIQDEEPEPEPEPTPSNPNLTDIFTDVADAIRSKTGKSDPLYPVNFANEIATIEAGGGGAELNIHYSSTTAPSDTSKLWVKTDTEPTKVSVSKDLALGAGTLSALSTNLPTGCNVVASGVVGTKIYLFGGKTGSSTYSNAIYRFDAATETITTLSATLPVSISEMASGVVGTKIYLFGGFDGSFSNKIYRFDTTTETITTLSTTLPNAISDMASGVVGTKIYLFGGTVGGHLNKIYRFDTTTETITTLSTTLPTATYAMASGVVGTKVYLFGGTIGDATYSYSNAIYRFDAATETITTLSATLPTRLSGMASGVVGTKIYYFGGYDGSRTDTICCFDSVNETITTLSTTLPTAANGMASGVVGTKIYLFGGYTGSIRLNTIRRFAVSFALAENSLLLLDTGGNSFNLVNSNELVIESKPKQVYIGDMNDEGEYVESALYANGAWQAIG